LGKYILRPLLANDRLKILDNGNVRLDFKKPWRSRVGQGLGGQPPSRFLLGLRAMREHAHDFGGIRS
jgi:hypothetical protein